MQMFQSVGDGGVLPPSKWRKHYDRTNNARVRKNYNFPMSCEATAGPGNTETAGLRMPSLPYAARLQLAAFAAAQRADGSIRPQLFSLGDLKASASPQPSGARVRSADVTVDAARGLWARVFCPPAAGNAVADYPALPVVVYFHGGGFVLFSPASRLYDALCHRLCRDLGAVVVSVNYRLAPRHRFPAAYDDGVAALRCLDAGSVDLPVPVDVSSCFVAGNSSGGNIAHHVAQRWAAMASSSAPARRLRLAGAILVQPFFGGEERTGSELALATACPSLTLASADYYWREFLPEGATRDHGAACVCGPGVDVADSFPPTMVVVGGFDLLKDRHERYVEKLRDTGKSVKLVEYPEAIHGFYLFPEIADSGKLMGKMKLFVEEHRSKRVV